MASEFPDIPHNMPRVYRHFERWLSAHTGRLPIPGRLWATEAQLARWARWVLGFSNRSFSWSPPQPGHAGSRSAVTVCPSAFKPRRASSTSAEHRAAPITWKMRVPMAIVRVSRSEGFLVLRNPQSIPTAL